ncbi:MAG: MarP family serine protease [Thermoleophilia bacterium]|nr:MarP family serine protease [Thermoleophilia bacterium]
MSWVDPLVLLWVALSALLGYQRGFAAQTSSLVGLVLGAFTGSRIAPLLVGGGSEWVPFASLAGAVVGAVVLQTVAGMLGGRLRRLLPRGGPRLADSIGGIVVGAAVGVAVAWLAAAAALQAQGSGLRHTVRESPILTGLVEAVPPRSVLRTLARLDPLPLIAASPGIELPPPDGSVLDSPVARRAGASVVKVLSVACSTGVQGSGWAIARELVATNAHVVAGQDRTRIVAPNGQVLDAELVYVDAADDVALLAVDGLLTKPLRLENEPAGGEEAVLLGYPGDGPLVAAAATVGVPTKVFAPGAYGGRVRLRTVVPLRADVERGASGGPVIDGAGRVVAMVFAAAKTGGGGYGIPVSELADALEAEPGPVDAGPCP